MKRYLLLILIAVLSVTAQAQRKKQVIKWFSLAAKGGYGNTMLLNSSINNDIAVTRDFKSPSYFYGLRFGFTHGDNFGVSAEGLWYTFNQSYDIDLSSGKYTKDYNFKSFDYTVLLRYTSDLGFIVEGGPKFTTLKTAKYEMTGDGLDGTSVDIMESLNTKLKGVTFGIGNSIKRGDRVELNFIVRANYGLTDLMVYEETAPNYLMEDKRYTRNTDNFVESYMDKYSKTHPLTIQAVLELNYFFAFFGDAKCGKGRLMFFR